ncbi:hypothetical protein ADH76_03225 [Enterocloster clostridioformis]|uniref:polyketide synthase n=1 Tax=Enterocloster clostridioformis TaxID=1531 RepID=UPI00080CB1A3|nr:polyketide synthase [Enterocloster clostridioformis]ANU44645.1 hypothetical protein A4V08_01205 [Lachnoclostridium sp. YL32]NDO27993.1 enoyl-CoA hydratase [Enterocloster clostridioformis]OXE70448.1 hypothetical protein ADH76_03225 [Enterocloster clostridioformis]QQR00600.1 enoyl-CoA hydratase/isomerase family protein [Enterocloster clostridioformis]
MSDGVVRLKKEGHVAYVILEEKEFKNTLTIRFIQGLKWAFEEIEKDSEIKVVVVHGYDNYFCCGGTKEGLHGLYDGVMKGGGVQFTDMDFHDIMFRCRVPVIAAMQGHALGGGLALGCFADIVIMGEQCVYNASFMKYGFTPGMGATYIIPKRFGALLGNEMLFTARNYFGTELKERGINAIIIKKEEVIGFASDMARDIADKPLISLIELKKALTSHMAEDIKIAVDRELEMHRISFKQAEVIERIEGRYRE